MKTEAQLEWLRWTAMASPGSPWWRRWLCSYVFRHRTDKPGFLHLHNAFQCRRCGAVFRWKAAEVVRGG